MKFAKVCFDENKCKNINNTEKLLLQFKYGTIVHKAIQDADTISDDTYEKYTVVQPKDIVINGLNLNYDFVTKRIGMVKERGIITSAYLVVRNKALLTPEYSTYLMKSFDGQKVFHGMGSGLRLTLSFSDFAKMQFPIPPREEQDQIVRYLDWKVSQINKMIHGYQKQRNLLEEQCKSQICYMVTHDRYSTERKESDIYWLADIPAGWHVTRLKRILKKQNRPVENAELLICSNHGDVKPRGDNKLGLVADNDDIYQGVKKGDLLIHGMDTWHGAIAISQYDGMCTPVVHVCTSNESLRFICYYLRMMAFTKVFKAISNGVRQNTSDFRSWDKAGSLMIALPSKSDQEAIADVLDKIVENTEIAKIKLNRQIELLKEYRTTLISDVVTGKIDVRNVNVPDYESESDDFENDDEEGDLDE